MKGFRIILLKDMAALTTSTPREEISRVIGSWRRYREEVTTAGVELGEPGEAQTIIESMYVEMGYRNFDKVRARFRQTSKEAMKAKRKYAKGYYETTAKALRSTPEAKAKLAAQRKEQRRRKALGTNTVEGRILAEMDADNAQEGK
jgi:hypothetical protein